ncbi:replication/maintenance protein RepL, partial [Vibrio gigantis]|uniref:replication/maintenance protein RepL n=1 Tax=Vibrio gigantis TaxID=296199 RepID=UPI001BFD9A42
MNRNKNTIATRKVKAGTTQMIDPSSGELKTVQHYEVKDVDINWNKVWLGHMLDVLDMVGNKKMQVLSWLLENRDLKTNEIVATQQEIMDELNFSKQTISDTFKALQSQKVIIKIRNGKYQLSPDFIWKGDSDNR